MTTEEVVLTDSAGGATARVLAGFGFNCYRFETVCDGRRIDVLWAADGFHSGSHSPSGSGIPILFPFPGRIAGTTMHWEGREYTLPAGDGRGNAIHGFVHRRPWRVVHQTGDRLVGEFHASRDDPPLLDAWPADFRIQADYQVRHNSLVANYKIDNPDVRPLPCGLGTHPYFRVPLGGGSADACVVKLPVATAWELDGMNATGRNSALDDAASFRAGLRFGEMKFDNVFGGLDFVDGVCTTSIHDPGSGRTMTMTFDQTFRECVVYNPAHREAVCIEPYTCVPDPFRLNRQGIDAGLRVLAPGESFTAQVAIRID